MDDELRRMQLAERPPFVFSGAQDFGTGDTAANSQSFNGLRRLVAPDQTISVERLGLSDLARLVAKDAAAK